MNCCKCQSPRVAGISSYGRDCQNFSIGNKDHEGYGYDESKLAKGDSLGLDYCLDCGQIQGVKFPIPLTELELEEDFQYSDGTTINDVKPNDIKGQLIHAWKPLFDLYLDLKVLPVFVYGRYYKYECRGSAFSNSPGEDSFVDFCYKYNISFDNLDKPLLENIYTCHEDEIYSGEIGGFYLDDQGAIAEWGDIDCAGTCFFIIKDESGQLMLVKERCDSGE